MGHRGHATTKNVISSVFATPHLNTLVSDFLDACKLCPHVKGGKVVPRPWAPTLTTNIPNHILHWDFLQMGESNEGPAYLLVLKDAASHFVHLVPCVTPTADVAAKAIMSWMAKEGKPSIWVSDNGSHFKNATMQFIAQTMHSQQHFVIAYSPWKNGAVERVNRDILQLCRTMLTEFKWDTKEWPSLVPLVEHNLNHSVVASLANHAPIEVMKGRQPDNPLRTIINPQGQPVEVNLNQDVETALEALRTSLHRIHKQIEEAQSKQQLLNMQQQKIAQLVNFEVGDFVLRSRVDEVVNNKLYVTWVGPYKVVEANESSFTVEHMITKTRTRVHSSRLKFYHDPSLEMTQEWIEHISSQGQVLQVESFLEHRWNEVLEDFEIKIHWEGFEPVEDSWEPFTKMYKDVRVALERYVSDKDEQLRAYLLKIQQKLTVEDQIQSLRVNTRKRKQQERKKPKSKKPRTGSTIPSSSGQIHRPLPAPARQRRGRRSEQNGHYV